jgi:hypothetical protein
MTGTAAPVDVPSVETALRAARDRGRAVLVPYVTGGITADWTDHLLAYQAAGADAIEIGLPFSDPMLDGSTIQRASDQALARGTTVTADRHDVRQPGDPGGRSVVLRAVGRRRGSWADRARRPAGRSR